MSARSYTTAEVGDRLRLALLLKVVERVQRLCDEAGLPDKEWRRLITQLGLLRKWQDDTTKVDTVALVLGAVH